MQTALTHSSCVMDIVFHDICWLLSSISEKCTIWVCVAACQILCILKFKVWGCVQLTSWVCSDSVHLKHFQSSWPSSPKRDILESAVLDVTLSKASYFLSCYEDKNISWAPTVLLQCETVIHCLLVLSRISIHQLRLGRILLQLKVFSAL